MQCRAFSVRRMNNWLAIATLTIPIEKSPKLKARRTHKDRLKDQSIRLQWLKWFSRICVDFSELNNLQILGILKSTVLFNLFLFKLFHLKSLYISLIRKVIQFLFIHFSPVWQLKRSNSRLKQGKCFFVNLLIFVISGLSHTRDQLTAT